MFNENIKNEYLIESNQEKKRDMFEKSYKLENALNKDLYNFNLDELSELFYTQKLTTKKDIKNFSNFISRYISWAIENGYAQRNINPLTSIYSEWYDQFIEQN